MTGPRASVKAGCGRAPGDAQEAPARPPPGRQVKQRRTEIMPGKPSHPLVLDAGTTHVLRFNYSCAATLLQKIRGSNGSWILMTADEYRQGAFGGQDPGWRQAGYLGTSADYLARWASTLTGYPVTLAKDKKVILPDWDSPVAYQVRQA
jgi:hypothetical protein